MDKNKLKILEELVASEPIEFNPECTDDLSSDANIPNDYSYLDALKNYKPVSENDLLLFEKTYGVEFSHIKKVMDRVEKNADKKCKKTLKRDGYQSQRIEEVGKKNKAQCEELGKLINTEEEYPSGI